MAQGRPGLMVYHLIIHSTCITSLSPWPHRIYALIPGENRSLPFLLWPQLLCTCFSGLGRSMSVQISLFSLIVAKFSVYLRSQRFYLSLAFIFCMSFGGPTTLFIPTFQINQSYIYYLMFHRLVLYCTNIENLVMCTWDYRCRFLPHVIWWQKSMLVAYMNSSAWKSGLVQLFDAHGH